MQTLKVLTVATLVTISPFSFGAEGHGRNKNEISGSDWDSKSGLNFCNGQGLRRLLELVKKRPPKFTKKSNLDISDWQELSEVKTTWAKDIPGDKDFDSKVKSILIYPRGEASDSGIRSAKVALKYFNGTIEEINIDPPSFRSPSCTQYVYESDKDVPKGSIYKIHDELFVVPNEFAFGQLSNSSILDNEETIRAGDLCECRHKPLNFSELKASIICGKKLGDCECFVHSAPAIHRASYMYTMVAKCGGKESKAVPLIGELGLQSPVPEKNIVKK